MNPRRKMSVLSFKTYCIENYAEHSGKASSEVYDLFAHSGLLKMLQDDYEDLHGMGKEYLMDFFDKWFSGKKSENTHHLVKSILIPQVVSMLMEIYSISENEAIRIVYTSPTGKYLDDDSLGLYGQSAHYICGLIEKDIQRNPELLKNIMRVGMLL